MKKALVCWLLLAVMLLCACGGDLIHESRGDPMIGQCMHAYTEEVESKAPTCTSEGHSAYTRCRMCSEALTANALIPATGHTVENEVCTVCGKDCTVIWDPPRGKEVVLQLFTQDITLIVGEEIWEFDSNAFIINHETLSFASADESIATVDANGVVTPVSEGQTVITITAANDVSTQTVEFAVTVKDPFVPTEPVDIEIFSIMRYSQIPEFTSFRYFLSNPNDRGASPVEIWADTLQMLMIFDSKELDASVGVGDEGYDWYFDFYVRPKDDANKYSGGYQKATVQAWSIFKFDNQDFLYRLKFYDTILSQLEIGEYDVKISVRKEDCVVGWGSAPDLVWTEDSVAYVEYARLHSEINK